MARTAPQPPPGRLAVVGEGPAYAYHDIWTRLAVRSGSEVRGMTGGGHEYLEQHRVVPALRRADRGGAGSELVHLAAQGSPARGPGRRVVVAAPRPLSHRRDRAGRQDRLGGRAVRERVRVLAQDLGRRGLVRPDRADLPGLRRDPAAVREEAAGQEEGTQAAGRS